MKDIVISDCGWSSTEDTDSGWYHDGQGNIKFVSSGSTVSKEQFTKDRVKWIVYDEVEETDAERYDRAMRGI
jgi:hypothetical protein